VASELAQGLCSLAQAVELGERLAQVRVRRGRLDQGEAALREALDDLDELPDSGIIAGLADDVKRDLEAARARAGKGDLLEAPSEAEIAVLRLLATDLTSREISERLFLSPNTIRTPSAPSMIRYGDLAERSTTSRATFGESALNCPRPL